MVFLGWSRLHEVSEVIKHAVIQKRHDAFCNLEKVLNKHKNHFSNLLKNPVSIKIHIIYTLSFLSIASKYISQV